MKTIEWTDNLSTQYISYGDFSYELEIIDVETYNTNPVCDFYEFILSKDYIYYSTIDPSNNISTYSNPSSIEFKVSIPFCSSKDKNSFINRINLLVQNFSDFLREVHCKKPIKLYVFRNKDFNGLHISALIAVSSIKKEKRIQDLKVNTNLDKIITPSFSETWDSVLFEMGEFDSKRNSVEILYEEILDFEDFQLDRKHISNANFVLQLNSKSGRDKLNDFELVDFEKHHEYEVSVSNPKILYTKSLKTNSLKLCTDKFNSKEELSEKTHYMVNVFREITGSFFVKVFVKYKVQDDESLIAGIFCCNNYNPNDNQKENQVVDNF